MKCSDHCAEIIDAPEPRLEIPNPTVAEQPQGVDGATLSILGLTSTGLVTTGVITATSGVDGGTLTPPKAVPLDSDTVGATIGLVLLVGALSERFLRKHFSK